MNAGDVAIMDIYDLEELLDTVLHYIEIKKEEEE